MVDQRKIGDPEVHGLDGFAADPNPRDAVTREEFVTRLRQLAAARRRGALTIARHSGGLVGRSTIYNILAGKHSPSEESVEGFLRGCGLLTPWEREPWLTKYGELYPLNISSSSNTFVRGQANSPWSAILRAHEQLIEEYEAQHLPRVADRPQELAKLFEVVTAVPCYVAVEADIHAGKTALLTRLRRDLVDRGYRTITYYVDGTRSKNTVRQFLTTAVAQLLDLAAHVGCVDHGQRIERTIGGLQRQLQQLWMLLTSDPLSLPVVLIVDGLDEEQNDGSPAIMDTLPKLVGSSGRVVVSYGPSLRPLMTLNGLKVVRYPLTASPAAQVSPEMIHRRLAHLVQGHTEPVARSLLTIYAIATGPISDSDLVDFFRTTGIFDGDQLAIERFRRRISSALMLTCGADGVDRFSFGHPAYGPYVLGLVGVELASALTEHLLDWADSYAGRDWPEGTPVFLQSHLSTILEASGRSDAGPRLIALVSDQRRRLLACGRGYPEDFLSCLDSAATSLQSLPASPQVLAGRLNLLTQHHRVVSAVDEFRPSAIRALAVCGQSERALGMVRSMTDADHRLWTYCAIARSLAMQGDKSNALRAAEHAEQVLPECTDLSNRPLSLLSEAFVVAGDCERALNFAGQIILAINAGSFERIVEAFIAAGDMHGALRTTALIDDGWHRGRLQGWIARVAALDDVESAIQIADDPQTHWPRDATLSEIAPSIAATDPQRALRMADGLDQWYRKEALGSVAVALAHAGESKMAVRAAELTIGAAGSDDPSWGKAKAIAQAAQALATVSELTLARKHLHDAWQIAGMSHDRYHSHEVAIELFKASMALGDAAGAVDAACQVSPKYHGAEWLAMVETLILAGSRKQALLVTRRALHLFDVQGWFHEHSEQLLPIGEALVLCGVDDPVSAIERELWANCSAERPDDPLAVSTLWDVERLFGEGHVRAAAAAIDRHLVAAEAILDRHEKSKTMQALAGALATIGDTDRATKVAFEIEDGETKVKALAVIVRSLGFESAQQAQTLASQTLQFAASTDEFSRGAALESAALALAAAGLGSQAISTIESTDVDDVSLAMALSAVASEFARAGSSDWAIRATLHAIRAVKQINDPGDVGYVLTCGVSQALIDAVCADRPARTAVQNGFANGIATLSANRYAALDTAERRLAEVDLSQDPSLTSITLESVAQSLAVAAGGNTLKPNVSKIHPQRRAELLGAVALALANQGRATHAELVAEQALRASRDHDVETWSPDVLAVVAVALAKAGQRAWAIRVAAIAKSAITIGGDDYHPGVSAEIARALAIAGDIAGAKATVASIQDPAWQITASALVATEAEADHDDPDVPQAIERAHQLTAELNDPKSLAAMSRALTDLKDPLGAKAASIRATNLIANMKDPVAKALALASLATALARTRNQTAACQAAEDALLLIDQECEHPDLQCRAYGEIAGAFFAANDVRRATYAFAQAVRTAKTYVAEGLHPMESRDDRIVSVIESVAAAGQNDWALRLTRHLEYATKRPAAMVAWAKGCLAAPQDKHLTRLIETAQALRSTGATVADRDVIQGFFATCAASFPTAIAPLVMKF